METNYFFKWPKFVFDTRYNEKRMYWLVEKKIDENGNVVGDVEFVVSIKKLFESEAPRNNPNKIKLPKRITVKDFQFPPPPPPSFKSTKVVIKTNLTDGMELSGNNITIKNGKVIVDGVEMNNDERVFIGRISIKGNVQNLVIDSSDVTVNGNVETFSGKSGKVIINGSVNGNVTTSSGSVLVSGDAKDIFTKSGNVRTNRVKKEI